MKRWLFRGVFVALLILGCGSMAQAQLAVIDAANLTQNTVTAVNAVINTANWLLELLSLPQFILDNAEFLQYVATIEQLASEASAVGMDVQSLQFQLSLFALDTAPGSSFEYAGRMAEIRGQIFTVWSYAMRTQTLISTGLSTFRDVLRLLSSLASLVGGVQASQTIAQHITQLTTIQTELKTQTTAFQHAKAVEQLAIPFTEQSTINMNEHLWGDWAEGDVGI